MNHLNLRVDSTASTVSAVRSSQHQCLTAFYTFFHMITCTTICFFWATAPLLSTTLHQFHFCQICSVFSICPSNFLERPRLRRVNTETCFLHLALNQPSFKRMESERRTKAHQHHSLLVSSHNGRAAIFEGAADVVSAFVWVMDALLGYYHASKNKKISHLLFLPVKLENRMSCTSSRQGGMSIFCLVRSWFADVEPCWLNFCESEQGSALSSAVTFTHDLHNSYKEGEWAIDCTWYQSLQLPRLFSDNRISSLTTSLRCDVGSLFFF